MRLHQFSLSNFISQTLSLSVSPSLRSTTSSRNTTTTPGIKEIQGYSGAFAFGCQNFWRAHNDQHVRVLHTKGYGVVTPWSLHTPPGWSPDWPGARHTDKR
jgi:hypothetical protein